MGGRSSTAGRMPAPVGALLVDVGSNPCYLKVMKDCWKSVLTTFELQYYSMIQVGFIAYNSSATKCLLLVSPNLLGAHKLEPISKTGLGDQILGAITFSSSNLGSSLSNARKETSKNPFFQLSIIKGHFSARTQKQVSESNQLKVY